MQFGRSIGTLILSKPPNTDCTKVMYNFFVGNGTRNTQYCTLSIEKKTRLLFLEQRTGNEVESRYIRMTGQQVERLRNIVFKGNFHSAAIPTNYYKLERDVVTMCCREDNMVLKFRIQDIRFILSYYDRHKEFIARYDADFTRR